MYLTLSYFVCTNLFDWTTGSMESTKFSTKVVISTIKEKARNFLQNETPSVDNITVISTQLKTDNTDVSLACITSLHRIFSRMIKEERMYSPKELKDEDEKDFSPEEKYRVDLRNSYSEVKSNLLKLLHHKNTHVQELSLSVLMKLVDTEAKKPINKIPSNQTFPSKFYMRILNTLVCYTKDLQPLIVHLEEYLLFDDVRYYSLKFLSNTLKENLHKEVSEKYLNNIYALLSRIIFPDVDEEVLTNLMGELIHKEEKFSLNSLKAQRKLFSSVWLQFLRLKLTTSLYRKILVNLHGKVMPYMVSPLQLSDFLTESFNIGGAPSLLALNGLFVLMQKYNLEYPDFFKKVYSLFDPAVFHVKYRARFFFLTDLFLTSTHLPAYLVAAFAKKLARISLTAPTSGLMISIPFIYNLINRHPNCQVLLNRTEPTEMANDPYDFSEPDPAKCNALQSSLWELKTLQEHFHPDVTKHCNKIEHPLNKQEIDLSDLLELSTNEVFDKEVKKKKKNEVPMTFEEPEGLFSFSSDKMSTCWLLE